MPASIDARTPCIVGVAQRTWRDGESPEPLDMWEEVSRAAARDASPQDGGSGLLSEIGSIQVVYCMSWPYDDSAGRLAARVGAREGHRLYSGIGGTTPQVLVNEASEAILRGGHDVVLVAGGEALDTKRQAKKRGERVDWSHRNPDKVPFPLEAPIHPSEITHNLLQAYLTFPLFDVARRAHLGVAPDDYRMQLGETLAPMTRIAAKNPHAWFPTVRTADEIVDPAPGNRMVGYPYTKYMVAMMNVDMAGALILTSEERADDLGIPRDRRVYPRGWAYGTEAWNIGERHEMWRSPAIERTSAAALDMAGVAIDDVAHLDLYSCFSSSLNLATDALGMSRGDPRPLTVTGGLPYAGGPANNYMTHAIASMVGTLRDDAGSVGLVSGVGMHMTKHVYAAYSTEPGPLEPVDGDAIQADLDGLPERDLRDAHAGAATIAAYTLSYTREGEPEALIAVCDLPDGARCYARGDDEDLLSEAERTELVGADVEIVPGENDVNLLKV